MTSSITHATPAAFYAHQSSRKSEEAIAVDILASGLDLFIGGGRQFFAERSDGCDLLAELRAAGYEVVDDPAGLAASKGFAPRGPRGRRTPADHHGRARPFPARRGWHRPLATSRAEGLLPVGRGVPGRLRRPRSRRAPDGRRGRRPRPGHRARARIRPARP
ncbi:MAG: alkaline phosphatase [Holophagales bacterium]|nr:alkaline phosphatase [Holophagales bacterium]